MDGLGGFGNISQSLLDLAEDLTFTPTQYIENSWSTGIGAHVLRPTEYSASVNMVAPVVNRKAGLLVIPETQVPFDRCYGDYTGTYGVTVYGRLGYQYISAETSSLFKNAFRVHGVDLWNNVAALRVSLRKDTVPTLIIPRTVTLYLPAAHSTIYNMGAYESIWNSVAGNDYPSEIRIPKLEEQMIILAFMSRGSPLKVDLSSIPEQKRCVVWHVVSNWNLHAKLIPLDALL